MLPFTVWPFTYAPESMAVISGIGHMKSNHGMGFYIISYDAMAVEMVNFLLNKMHLQSYKLIHFLTLPSF